MMSSSNNNVLDVSVTSSFGSPIMFNMKRNIEVSAGMLRDIILGNECEEDDEELDSSADFADIGHMAPPPPPPILRRRPQGQHYSDNNINNRHSMHGMPQIRATSPVVMSGMHFGGDDLSYQQHPPYVKHQLTGSSIDLRRMGPQLSQHCPSRVVPTRRYSPPQGSTGSTKSPSSTPRTSWDHTGGQVNPRGPVSTSSPVVLRRNVMHDGGGNVDGKKAPYYVADTMNHPQYHHHLVEDSSLGMPYFVDNNSSGGSGNSAVNTNEVFLSHCEDPRAFQYANNSYESENGFQVFDDSMYRLLPPFWPPPALEPTTCLSHEEMQREYAVVLDAVRNGGAGSGGTNGNRLFVPCCSSSWGQQGQKMRAPTTYNSLNPSSIISAERCAQENSGSTTHFYTNCCLELPRPQQEQEQQQQQRIWQPCLNCEGPSLHHPWQSPPETCVDDHDIPEEDMVSSWSGVSGVPGLGFSIPPKDGATVVGDKLNSTGQSQEWSANSINSLGQLKVDLPRVLPHSNSAGSCSAEGPTKAVQGTTAAPSNLPRLSKKSLCQQHSTYNGVSAVSHLLDGGGGGSGPNNTSHFQRHATGPPLRASVSSKLFGNLFGNGSSGHKQQGDPVLARSSGRYRQFSREAGPRSLPVANNLSLSDIPRAPIATPEAKGHKKAPAAAADNSHFVWSDVKKVPCPPQGLKVSPKRRRDISANNEVILRDRHHYQSPNDRDGDYSYAYDCSISPAVVIKWNDEEEDDEEEEQEQNELEGEKKHRRRSNGSENIYEEIDDVASRNLDQEGSGGSTVNSDSGIGGTTSARHHVKVRQGTLDIGPRKKRPVSTKASQDSTSSLPLSSLDVLLSQTSPGMTPHQRLNMRKSLVDELFEELIQRHHKRVIDELKLDVEEFIAPSPGPSSPTAGGGPEETSIGTPRSVRSSVSSGKRSKSASSPMPSSGNRLRKCESMDFKDQGLTTSTTKKEKRKESHGLKDHILSSARKYSEVFNRKYFARRSSTTKKATHDNQTNVQLPQVTRRGRRPLSAFLSRTTMNEVIAEGSSDKLSAAGKDSDCDSDSEDDSARRLQRSKIIQSFWEQHDQEEQDNNNEKK